jgi:hypothetical protein
MKTQLDNGDGTDDDTAKDVVFLYKLVDGYVLAFLLCEEIFLTFSTC